MLHRAARRHRRAGLFVVSAGATFLFMYLLRGPLPIRPVSFRLRRYAAAMEDGPEAP
jgi:hypothetical protein